MDGHRENRKQGTVLFVDDERRVLTSMRATFRRDYEVLLANSGTEAIDLLREHDVDVIVSDQRMPGMTGVEVLKQVKTLAPRAMRILLTGYADLTAIEASINEGEVFRFLTKPCATEQLREAIELAVEASIGAPPADVDSVDDAIVDDTAFDAMSVELMVGDEMSDPHVVDEVVSARTAGTESAMPDFALQPVIEVVSADGAASSLASTSDEFELIEVVPKGGTATPRPPPRPASPRQATPAKPERPQAVAPPPPPPEAPKRPPPGVNLIARPTSPVAPATAHAPQAPRPIRLRPPRHRTAPTGSGAREVELLVLTRDKEMVRVLEAALDGKYRLHAAGDLEQAVSLIEAHPIGVVITDLAVREDEIATLTGELKRHVPQLVTIVASERSDAQLLIDLINFGQIFRFLLKPLHAGQCRLSIESAVGRHREFALDPSLARRHAVAVRPKDAADGVIQHVMARVRRLRARFSAANGAA